MIEMVTKYIAIILSSLDLKISNRAMVYFSSIIINLINDLFVSLKRVMHQQRRLHPGYIDLALTLKMFGVEPGELLYQLDLAKAIKNGPLGSSLNVLKTQSEELLRELDELAGEDELYKQDKDYEETLALMPSTNKRKFYIQNFIPDFPPDHTYRYSAVYTKKVEDPKQLRQILVDEGNSALKSLLSLQTKKDEDKEVAVNKTENSISKDHALLSPPLSPVNNEISPEKADEKVHLTSKIEEVKEGQPEISITKETKIGTLNGTANRSTDVADQIHKGEPQKDNDNININLPTRPLDIVKYAKDRLAMISRKQKRKYDQINTLRRDESYVRYIKIQKHLNSYKSNPIETSLLPGGSDASTDDGKQEEEKSIEFPIDASIGDAITSALNDEYSTLMNNLKIEKKQKQLEYQEKLKIRKQKEEERKQREKEQEKLAAEHHDNDMNDLDFDNFEFGFDDDNFDIVHNEEELIDQPQNQEESQVDKPNTTTNFIKPKVEDESTVLSDIPETSKQATAEQSTATIEVTATAQKAPVPLPKEPKHEESVEFNFDMSDNENHDDLNDESLDNLLGYDDAEDHKISASAENGEKNKIVLSKSLPSKFPVMETGEDATKPKAKEYQSNTEEEEEVKIVTDGRDAESEEDEDLDALLEDI